MSKFDVVVIGAGPGGYVCAIRCGQLGLKTACVDAWLDPKGKPSLGGTCLNVGCIPSKALLDSSHHYHNLTALLPAHGINIDGASIDVATMQARKDKVVKTLTRGIAGLLRKNKVEVFAGRAAFKSATDIEVTGQDGEQQTIQARHIVIATGSVPVNIPVAKVDGVRIVDNEGALAFAAVPNRLGIIGAGVIGLELGSVWNRLGADVVVLEALDDFLPGADRQIAREAQKVLTKQGLDIRLGAKVTGSTCDGDTVSVSYQGKDGDQTIEVDNLVVAVGRKPHTDGLDPQAAGVAMDDAGRIQIDDHCRTSIDGIFAIGDVVQGPMLAHKASEEGIAVAELIAGQAAHIDHATVPWVIYTHPEIAWVGKTEQDLKAQGVAYRVGTFPYLASGRAQGAGETSGLVKVIGDAESDRILGVHIFGAQASELIAEAVTAMEFHASTEDLARTIHAHPTLSETLHEAALAVDKRAIHV